MFNKIKLYIFFVLILVIKTSDLKHLRVQQAQHEDPEYEDYEELIEEQNENEDPEFSNEQLLVANYQKLFINELKIDLVEDNLDNLSVFYGDEVVLECDLPQDLLFTGSSIEWVMNGEKLHINETSLEFRPTKYRNCPKRNFNFSCFFHLKNHLNFSNMIFPTFIISIIFYLNIKF